MYKIMIEDYFAAAHRLRKYKGDCEKLHGHNFKVQVYLLSSQLNSLGMVIDFREVKEKLKKILQYFDHNYLNELEKFKNLNPTTENIAKIIFDKLNKCINNIKIKLEKVIVWETSNSCASYQQ